MICPSGAALTASATPPTISSNLPRIDAMNWSREIFGRPSMLHPRGRSLLDTKHLPVSVYDIREHCQKDLPHPLAEMGEALRDRDAPRLREAAHKLCALLPAFSTAAGEVASDVEIHAAQGRLDEARPLVERLEAMAQELLGLVGGLSL